MPDTLGNVAALMDTCPNRLGIVDANDPLYVF
jgi:hypothetical protein